MKGTKEQGAALEATAPKRPNRELERTWLRMARQGDADAFDRLVRAHLGFVVSIARRWSHGSLPLEDLVQEGVCGLIEAIRRFDESRGFRLLTFARSWIEREIRRACQRADYRFGGGRLPEDVYADGVRIAQSARRLRHALGREPEHREVVADACVPAARAQELRTVRARSLVSLSVPDGGASLSVADPSTPDLVAELIRKQRIDRLRQALATLPRRQAAALRRGFGLDAGERSGRAPQRVDERRTLCQALEALRKHPLLDA